MLHKIYYFTLYLFPAMNDSILKIKIPFKSGIILKKHISFNFMLKYYDKISLRQFTKTLK